jgi:hypothetical protein
MVWPRDKDHLGIRSASIEVDVKEKTATPPEYLKHLETLLMEIVNAIAVLLAILSVVSLSSGFILGGI